MKKLFAAGTVSVALLFGGCSGGGYGSVGPANLTGFNGNPGGSTPPTQKAATAALFQPSAGLLPYPFDVYFAGSTDGTLNIQPANALMPAQNAINALDGFSTTAVIRERFAGPIDAASLSTPGAVVVVHITTDNRTKGPVPPSAGGVVQPLAPGVDYSVARAAEDPSILEITPLKPLAASSCLATGPACATGQGYLVLLTKAITLGGASATADTDYANIETALATGGAKCPSITDPTLNGICQLTGGHLQLAQALGINPVNVVASFSFTTQSTLDTLAAAAAQATAQPIAVNFTGQTTAAFLPPGLAAGIADVYVGTIQLPYYLSRTSPDTEYWHAAAASSPDQTSTLTTRYNPFPVKTELLKVPVLMCVPNASSGQVKPPTGWPIVIFQHGITANRTNVLAIAEAFAHAGMVAIAIDLPLHGLTVPFDQTKASTYLYASSANPFYAGLGLPASGSIERTFDLDTLNNTTLAPGPDGVIDGSGLHFLNFSSLLTMRDNLREASADLVTFAKSVSGITLPLPATAPYIDGTKIHFVGHSMGAITGTNFLAVDPGVTTGTLANPGGAIVALGLESAEFGPIITAGVKAASNGLLVPGTTLFAQFARDAQTAVDSGDPWNFIAQAAALHAIHMIQVIGPPPDHTVPNDSTGRLIAAGGLTQVHAPGAAGASALHVFVNFTAGTHSSILDPSSSPAATTEMQTETVAFALTGGTSLPVSATAPVQ
jgi:pimeloyl-ACP methyl ester carboxylesterase